jgi:hypothetical protein
MRHARLEPETLSVGSLAAAIPVGGFIFDAVFCLSGPMAADCAR